MERHLETVLRHERILVGATLALVVLIAAVYTAAGVGMEMSAFSMTFGTMGEMGAMGMKSMKSPVAGDWSWLKFLLMFLMWWLMMIAMMLPSAAPAVLLYATVLKRNQKDASALPALLFTAGYLLAWAGFSLAATAAQLGLETSGLVSPTMMVLVTGPAGALVAISVGAYQFTPFKHRCLTLCRAPADFLAKHHRPGTFGTLRLGVLHGAYCLGCCFALMALLFVGGVMNLFWIVGIAGFVALEKLGPRGRWFSHVAGALLIVYGVTLLGYH